MKNKIQDLIKTDRYQVFLLDSRASFPLSFARHPWFVVNKKGKIFRWAVGRHRIISPGCRNYLHLNVMPPFSGVPVFTFSQKHFWRAKVLEVLEGDENSSTKKIIDFIEQSEKTYPFCDKYFLTGPNSNTYVEWVLNNFSDFKIKLPWNCFGKSFAKKIK